MEKTADKASKKSRRGLIVGVAAGAAVIIAAVVILLLLRSPGYRTVQIYRLDGQAEVVRPPEDVMMAYEGMMLISDDRVSTYAESYLYLKMDEDKYMLAEPETVFSLTALGTAAKSRTRIDLEAGAVVSHVTRPLGDSSSYEVSTPNSVMAVRGTSFRVFVWYDEDGVSHTILQIFEGVVSVRLLYPDGTQSGERLFYAGEAVSIWGSDMTSDYDENEYPGIVRLPDGDVGAPDYYALEIPTLEFLKIGIEDLPEYPLTVSDVNEIIRLKQTTFTVSFTVEGELFATQPVLFDGTAWVPAFAPAPNGHWDFDFTARIREDTEIPWVD